MATTYGARLHFRDTSAASCKGLVHGSADRMQKSRAQSMTWKAREPLVKWLLLALAIMGNAKGTLNGVLMRLARTYSSRGPDRTLKGPHWHPYCAEQLSFGHILDKRNTCSRYG